MVRGRYINTAGTFWGCRLPGGSIVLTVCVCCDLDYGMNCRCDMPEWYAGPGGPGHCVALTFMHESSILPNKD